MQSTTTRRAGGRLRSALVAGLWCTVVAAPTHAQTAPGQRLAGVVVKNRRVEFTFAHQYGLCLVEAHRRQGVTDRFEFHPAPLWEVTLRDPTQPAGSRDSVWSPATAASQFDYTLQQLSDRTRLQMDWTGVVVDGSNDLDVQVVFELRQGQKVGSFTGTVTARTPDYALFQVDLPRLPVSAPPATEDTWLVTGWAGGTALRNPQLSLQASAKGWNTNVPSLNAAEFFTLYQGADPASVLYASTGDAAAYAKTFSFSAGAGGDELLFALRHYPEDHVIAGATSYTVPYSPEVGVLDGEGGWWGAAVHYRNWAREAGVLPARLKQRTDLSSYVRNADLFARCGVDFNTKNGTGDYTAINDRVQAWFQYFNDCSSPLTPDCVPGVVNFDQAIVMVAGWHGCQPGKQTNWFMFHPPADPTVFDMLDQAPAGVHFIPYFNPLRLSDNDVGNAWLAAYASLDEDGDVERVSDQDGDPLTMSTLLDSSSQDVNAFLRDQIVSVLQPDGWSGVYLDNWTNKDGSLEYAANDGHPAGGGNFMATELLAAIQDIRGSGRLVDPDFVLAIEHLSQSALGDVDFTYENSPTASSYLCSGGSLDWYVAPVQAVVYNGFLYRTRSQMALDDIQPFEEDIMKYLWTLHLNQMGLEPAFTNGDSDELVILPPPNQRNEELYRFLQKMLRMYHFQEDFFKYGRRMKDPFLAGIRTVPSCTLWTSEHRYLAPQYGAGVYPSVMASAWKSGDRLAISLVNWQGASESFTLEFDAVADYRMEFAAGYDLFEEKETGRVLLGSFGTPWISYADSIGKENNRVFVVEGF